MIKMSHKNLKRTKRQLGPIDLCLPAPVIPVLLWWSNTRPQSDVRPIPPPTPPPPPPQPTNQIKDFESFKSEFRKAYLSVAEEVLRQQIFLQNLAIIEGHNQLFENGQSTYFLKVNLFTDLTFDEFRKSFLGQGVFGGKFVITEYNLNIGHIYRNNWSDKQKIWWENLFNRSLKAELPSTSQP